MIKKKKRKLSLSCGGLPLLSCIEKKLYLIQFNVLTLRDS